MTIIDIKEKIIIQGIVQGVGFRPFVWQIAQLYKLTGNVSNNGDGVIINVQGTKKSIDRFIEQLQKEKPPLSRIDTIIRHKLKSPIIPNNSFEIISSQYSEANTGIMADAATCNECLEEIFSPSNRRYTYPFTNCTHCGPRLSIINGIPYDRKQTSMAKFPMCEECLHEYQSPDNRRFHAQPNACSHCGPHYWITDSLGKIKQSSKVIDTVVQYLEHGKIVAIKGIGSFHLAVLATNKQSIAKLRTLKNRPCKPFALMARDTTVIERYCTVTEQDTKLLKSSAAPIVLMDKKSTCNLPENIAFSTSLLGFMLPYSPLHHLLLTRLSAPIILTSANISHEPPCIKNKEALEKLSKITDYFLLHNRDIENRVDDSIVRISANIPQILRRARGYAPQSILLPKGFEKAPDILALGGDLKNTFCLLKNGQAFISQHMGDLENYATYNDYQHNLTLYKKLFQHQSKHIVVDMHPEYISNKKGEELAQDFDVSLHKVQHHHAHIASCLADNNYELNHDDVLGVVLDGLGFGNDNKFWGGEFIQVNYKTYTRLAYFKPIALLGGNLAMRQPWRNLYAHIYSCIGWQNILLHYSSLKVVAALKKKPLETMEAMIIKQVNSPLASSAGRLFDAVAAAVGICFEQIQYEGQAAIELEAKITPKAWLAAQDNFYTFRLEQGIVDPTPMWEELLNDLLNSVSVEDISARFHQGLAIAIQRQVGILNNTINTIVLSGGVFQNKTLLEAVKKGLEKQKLNVLIHQRIPTNDGGISLGQAVIVAANILETDKCV